MQMVGTIGRAVHKRIDTAATAVYAGLGVEELSDLDLSYTPPLGSHWDVSRLPPSAGTSTYRANRRQPHRLKPEQ